MRGWHFIAADRRLRYGDGSVVEPGYVYSVEGEPRLCEWGLHASVRAIDALNYAPGPIVCRVDVTGDLIKGNDKFVGRRREVLWMADATETLHLFACDEAERALSLICNPDPRAIAAIATKRAWLRGDASGEDLAAAQDAARAAARAAAQDAAQDAAWAAARASARAAAQDAAWAAARAAARAAAQDAAWAAAWAAALDAALDAAWAAAQDAANRRLTRALKNLEPK